MSHDLSTDRGLTLGVGLFETVLALEGRLVLWDAHLARLARGCASLCLPAPDPLACRDAADEALADLRVERAALRLTWTGGDGLRGLETPARPEPRLIVTASASASPPTAMRLSVSAVRRNPSSPASRLKTLSSLDQVAARSEARAAGGDEALMLNTAGEVACAAAGNLFWMKDGVLRTPRLECGVLDGIVRGEVIAAAGRLGLAMEETATALDNLLQSDWVVVSNSLIGLVPVSAVDARTWPAPSSERKSLIHALTPAAMQTVA